MSISLAGSYINIWKSFPLHSPCILHPAAGTAQSPKAKAKNNHNAEVLQTSEEAKGSILHFCTCVVPQLAHAQYHVQIAFLPRSVLPFRGKIKMALFRAPSGAPMDRLEPSFFFFFSGPLVPICAQAPCVAFSRVMLPCGRDCYRVWEYSSRRREGAGESLGSPRFSSPCATIRDPLYDEPRGFSDSNSDLISGRKHWFL